MELLTELQAQCQEEHQALVVTTWSQARMKVSKSAKPNELESTSDKGDETPESDGLGFCGKAIWTWL